MRRLALAWRALTQRLKEEQLTLYYVYRDPRLPWYVRLVVALVVGYAFSPIDLIPDFIPILGLLDDALLLPLGVWLVLRLVPDEIMLAARAAASARLADPRPVSRAGALMILALWLLALLLAGGWMADQMTVR